MTEYSLRSSPTSTKPAISFGLESGTKLSLQETGTIKQNCWVRDLGLNNNNNNNNTTTTNNNNNNNDNDNDNNNNNNTAFQL